MHKQNLHGIFENYSHENISRGPLSHYQPVLAWFGLFGCLATVGFSTASWWQFGEPSASNILATFTAVSEIIINVSVYSLVFSLF